jgi:hypothetical protein
MVSGAEAFWAYVEK